MDIIVAFAYCKVYSSFGLGFVVATPIIYVGVMFGALAAFLLSQYLFKNYIKKKLKRSKSEFCTKFRVIDKMFETDGIFFVALIRLTIVPFGIACYFLGVTQVSLVDYLLGTSAYIVYIVINVLLGCSLYQATEASE